MKKKNGWIKKKSTFYFKDEYEKIKNTKMKTNEGHLKNTVE